MLVYFLILKNIGLVVFRERILIKKRFILFEYKAQDSTYSKLSTGERMVLFSFVIIFFCTVFYNSSYLSRTRILGAFIFSKQDLSLACFLPVPGNF